MQLGFVKWYDCKKGYGFIVTDTGEDVLAHYSVIEGTGFRRLWDGEPVEFEATRGPKGLNARFVRRLNPARSHEAKPPGSSGTALAGGGGGDRGGELPDPSAGAPDRSNAPFHTPEPLPPETL